MRRLDEDAGLRARLGEAARERFLEVAASASWRARSWRPWSRRSVAAEGAASGGGISARRRALGLAAGLLILVFLALGAIAGWDKVDDYDWHVDPAAAAAGFAALLALYAVSALGYVFIIEQLAGRRVPRRRFVALWALLAARALRARQRDDGGEPARARAGGGDLAQGLTRRERVRAGALAGRGGRGGLLLLAAYGADEIGPAAWLVALVPLGLVVLHPRLFGRLTGGRCGARSANRSRRS